MPRPSGRRGGLGALFAQLAIAEGSKPLDMPASTKLDLADANKDLYLSVSKWLRKRGQPVKPRLSEEQKLELKECFGLMDLDGSGAIDVDEFEEALGLLGLQMSRKEVEKLFDEVDKDGTGQLEYDEYLEVMTDTLQKLSEEAEASANGVGGGVARLPFNLMSCAYRRKRYLEQVMSGDQGELAELVAIAESGTLPWVVDALEQEARAAASRGRPDRRDPRNWQSHWAATQSKTLRRLCDMPLDETLVASLSPRHAGLVSAVAAARVEATRQPLGSRGRDDARSGPGTPRVISQLAADAAARGASTPRAATARSLNREASSTGSGGWEPMFARALGVAAGAGAGAGSRSTQPQPQSAPSLYTVANQYPYGLILPPSSSSRMSSTSGSTHGYPGGPFVSARSVQEPRAQRGGGAAQAAFHTPPLSARELSSSGARASLAAVQPGTAAGSYTHRDRTLRQVSQSGYLDAYAPGSSGSSGVTAAVQAAWEGAVTAGATASTARAPSSSGSVSLTSGRTGGTGSGTAPLYATSAYHRALVQAPKLGASISFSRPTIPLPPGGYPTAGPGSAAAAAAAANSNANVQYTSVNAAGGSTGVSRSASYGAAMGAAAASQLLPSAAALSQPLHWHQMAGPESGGDGSGWAPGLVAAGLQEGPGSPCSSGSEQGRLSSDVSQTSDDATAAAPRQPPAATAVNAPNGAAGSPVPRLRLDLLTQGGTKGAAALGASAHAAPRAPLSQPLSMHTDGSFTSEGGEPGAQSAPAPNLPSHGVKPTQSSAHDPDPATYMRTAGHTALSQHTYTMSQQPPRPVTAAAVDSHMYAPPRSPYCPRASGLDTLGHLATVLQSDSQPPYPPPHPHSAHAPPMPPSAHPAAGSQAVPLSVGLKGEASSSSSTRSLKPSRSAVDIMAQFRSSCVNGGWETAQRAPYPSPRVSGLNTSTGGRPGSVSGAGQARPSLSSTTAAVAGAVASGAPTTPGGQSRLVGGSALHGGSLHGGSLPAAATLQGVGVGIHSPRNPTPGSLFPQPSYLGSSVGGAGGAGVGGEAVAPCTRRLSQPPGEKSAPANGSGGSSVTSGGVMGSGGCRQGDHQEAGPLSPTVLRITRSGGSGEWGLEIEGSLTRVAKDGHRVVGEQYSGGSSAGQYGRPVSSTAGSYIQEVLAAGSTRARYQPRGALFMSPSRKG